MERSVWRNEILPRDAEARLVAGQLMSRWEKGIELASGCVGDDWVTHQGPVLSSLVPSLPLRSEGPSPRQSTKALTL
jgi:hypothetical protein